MRLIFAGTPDFAAHALTQICAAGHQVVLVLTQPDRPAGRGKKLRPSAVKQAALALDLAVFQPEKLRDSASQQRLLECQADVMVVAAYGLILPQVVLDIPRFGCLNIHASLLPAWRGAAPIQRSIQAGDLETGITIMQMDAGLDTGAIASVDASAILPGDSGGDVHDRLALLGGQAIVSALTQLSDGQMVSRPQPESGISYAHKLLAADRPIDWAQPVQELVNKVRAFDPVPGCTARLQSHANQALKIWRLEASVAPRLPANFKPGTIQFIDDGQVLVACADGFVRLLEVQRAGGKRLPISEFQRGQALADGDYFLPVADT